MFPVFGGLESHGDFAFGAVSERAALLTLRRSTSYPRWGGGGGGGAHMYVPPQRVWFWGHSGLESGMVFEGTTDACERKEKKSPDRRLACIVLIPNERTK